MRPLAPLLCLAIALTAVPARADDEAAGTLTLWPVPSLALTPGLAVTVDDAALSPEQLGRPVHVTPGVHVIRVTAPGRLPSETTVSAPAAGDDRLVILDVLARPAAAPPPVRVAPTAPAPAPDDGGTTPLRLAGYALGGAGLAAAIVGLGVALAAPNMEPGWTNQQDIATAGWSLTAVGAGMVLSGIVLVVVAPDDSAPVAGATMTGWSSPSSSGLALTASF